MVHKARLFFGTVTVSLFIIACTEEAVQEQVPVESHAETTELQKEQPLDFTKRNDAATAPPKETIDEDKKQNPANEKVAEEDEVSAKQDNSATESSVNTAKLDAAYQKALEHFIATTGLDIESYTFSFETTEEYIEITVYEKQEQEQAHTPLAGIYRYLFDSEEVLIQDYLTGAFIPYEEEE